MRPGKQLLILLAACTAISVIPVAIRLFLPGFNVTLLSGIWWTLLSLIFCAALLDYIISRKDLEKIQCERTTPGSLALGVNNIINLIVKNDLLRPVHLTITDQYPDQVDAFNIPRPLVLGASSKADIEYSVKPVKRGDAHFGFICIRLLSRLNLWQFNIKRGASDSVKVYPNFRSITQFKTLGLNQHIGQMGIHVKQRRGQGLNFHQLREFREGDSINQIDWNATARFQKPIAREYQDEKDQDVIFLLDCGRRMYAHDGQLSHFDHVLNAFLLTSHVALRQGDAVGLMTFAGTERWVSPIKGQHSINTLLNQVYDLHSSTDTSDFSQAAQRLINTHRKRSLVVILTNLHEEDSDDIKAGIKLISSKHLVIVANLREKFLDENIKKEVHSFESALNYSGTLSFIIKRNQLLGVLRKQGVFIADSVPHLLHINLINEYLALKRRGQI
ncbi:MAG: DUF58 domain-containing protein [Gammaproteobacteria bacterium]|nr:DUF58 domain-containing protein [Gammaproteobacteria bacterium]